MIIVIFYFHPYVMIAAMTYSVAAPYMWSKATPQAAATISNFDLYVFLQSGLHHFGHHGTTSIEALHRLTHISLHDSYLDGYRRLGLRIDNAKYPVLCASGLLLIRAFALWHENQKMKRFLLAIYLVSLLSAV
jgi:hypothetical protein